MKKLISFFMILSLVVINVYASSLPNSIIEANKELSEIAPDYYTLTNSNGKKLNVELASGNWGAAAGLNEVGTGQVYVYGEPTDFNSSVSRHRYLGETMVGDKFTNMLFPHDSWNSTKKLEERNWVKEPWKHTVLRSQTKEIKFDSVSLPKSDMYLPNMIAGLELYYHDVLNGSYKTKDWHNYIHVLQPPTSKSWGMGRMWHMTSDSNYWYMTVPLVPNNDLVTPSPTPTPSSSPTPSPAPEGINLKAQIINVPDSGYKDSNVSVTAKITAEGITEPFETTVVWKVNGVEVARNERFVLLNSRTSVMGVKIPSGGANVEIIVNPERNKPSNETTYDDNRDPATIKVKPEPPSDPGGDITVTITKADGSNTIAVHPQWTVDATKQLQTKWGASWQEVFEKGMVNKASFPQLNGKWNQTADFDYLNKTLAAEERKFNVTVNYKWTQTYHDEWKVVRTYTETVNDYEWDDVLMRYVVSGTHQETRREYGWVKVANPAPKAKVNLTVKTSGTVATQVRYNIASGQDAEISTEEKNTTENSSATINANSSKTFTFTMPLFSQLYPNAYNYFEPSDDGKAYLTASVSATVDSTRCTTCGDTISYVQPKATTNTKTIAVKACSVYSKSVKLGWDE